LKRYVVEGARNGPHVYINAGSHGDEFLAIDTAKKVYEELDPREVNGTISIVPEANIFATMKNKRETPEPEYELYESEERNLNRCFNSVDLEDGPTGNITERLAYHILKLAVDADYCFDLHTATAPGYKIDQIREKTHPDFSKDVIREQERLIRNSGVEYVIKTPPESIGEGVLAGILPKYGVPSVTVEIGGGAYSEDELERYVAVVMNLLKEAGALYGEPDESEQQVYQYLSEVWATTAGEYEAVKTPGEDVIKGEVLGVIRNERGEHEIESPFEGLVESIHRQDWVNEGTRIGYVATQQERSFLEAIMEFFSRIISRHRERVRSRRDREGFMPV
jgi:predicted deacylase